jgi:hypothetical protein
MPEVVMTQGRPVGGAVSVVLGEHSAKDMFDQRHADRSAVFEAPPAAPRFSQAPGGMQSIASDDREVAMRGPVGGATTVVLGEHDSREIFNERHTQRTVAIETPAALQRFTQAPGGDQSESSLGSITTRGPVGGAVSVVLGSASTKEVFEQHEARRTAAIETPDALPRFPQAPGGDRCTETFETMPATRGPVGGATGIVLGSESSQDTFAQAEAQRNQMIETPAAAPRFTQGPGGAQSVVVDKEVTMRGPVGGSTTVVLGDANAQEIFTERHAARMATIETPAALQRFPQAPGGDQSIPDSSSVIATRGPVGGASTVVLGSACAKDTFEHFEAQRTAVVETPDAAPRFTQAPGGNQSQQALRVDAVRGPVGGAVSVVLGDEDGKTFFDERAAARAQVFETPDAAPRFTQAPGGTQSVTELVEHSVRGPVGGAASIVLGSENTKEFFEQRQLDQNRVVETPNPNPRFTQAPGGAQSDSAVEHVPMRGPVGGAATVVLGGDDTQSIFNQRREDREKVLETPDATVRFPQGPGGTATVILGGDGPDNVQMQRASKQILQVPGGHSAIDISSDMPMQECGNSAQHRSTLQVNQAPGGTATICLGTDTAGAIYVSSNSFANGNSQNCGNTITDRSSTRLHQAPGGTSTICLGGDEDSSLQSSRSTAIDLTSEMPSRECGNSAQRRSTLQVHQAPGGTSTICLGTDSSSISSAVSANNFANGSNQNSGNVITDRSTTRLHQAPGGTSTIVLGADTSTEHTAISANSFANGSDQNCGNVITERSSTRLHQAPGGTSTICLGTDDACSDTVMSANSFANGSNQNCGNVITERSTTRLHQAPGGTATICLGEEPHGYGDENVDKTNVPEESAIKKVTGKAIMQQPGGRATVVLG